MRAEFPRWVYIGGMRAPLRHALSLLPLLLAVCAPGMAQGQGIAPNYALTRPAWNQFDPELSPRTALFALGPVNLATAGSTTGAGLSLQAGNQWFARFGAGRSLDNDVLSLGGGYRFSDGQALSMHVTRLLGQDRLGLAVRYDWQHSYMRVSYDTPLRPSGGAEMLRFSAGMKF